MDDHTRSPRVDPTLVYIETAPKRYIVKQPETGRYFRLSAEVVRVMQGLDGTTPIDALSHQLRLKLSAVQSLVDQLAQLDLLEQETRNRQKPSRWHLKPFLVCWDVIVNDAWMDRMYCILRLKYVFRFWFCIALLLLYSSAALMYVFSGQDLGLALEHLIHPSVANLLLLGTITLLTIVLHELAHGFMCKHFGGKVRSLGIGFYFFLPVFYADVTDAWLFTRKYQRLLTHAAGLLMNFFLASVALLCLPFALHSPVSMNIIAAFYLSSFLYALTNLNPLIKLDGYFLLADALGIENMKEKAMKVLFLSARQAIGRLGLGQPRPGWETRRLPRRERQFLQLYALLSLVYIGGLLFYLWQISASLLAPYFGVWSQMIITGILILLVSISVWKTRQKRV